MIGLEPKTPIFARLLLTARAGFPKFQCNHCHNLQTIFGFAWIKFFTSASPFHFNRCNASRVSWQIGPADTESFFWSSVVSWKISCCFV